MEAIVRDENIDAFLEFSPHPVLATSIRECCEAMNYQPLILSTLKRKEDEQSTLLTSLAQLTHSPVVWRSYLTSRSIQPNDGDHEKYLFDTFPLYAFNNSVFWYESKDSILERRAHRLSDHPLLGVRQLAHEQTSATWRSLINLQHPKYQYLRDHKIQDAILFPAGAFIELAIAACRELLPKSSDEQMSPIALEQVEYLKALHLTENELTEVYTQVIGMPMREWFVYSRPWSSGGLSCMRAGGMAGTDLIESFSNHQTLSEDAMREFTLHARGRIDIGPHLNLYASSALRLDPNDARFIDQDVSQLYAYLATRGYQYGPMFRVTQALKTSKSEIIAYTSYQKKENDVEYHMHPQMSDGSCNCVTSIMPGNDLYLPSSIGKLICFSGTAGSCDLITYGSFHSTLSGVASERSFAIDVSVFDGSGETNNTKPLFMLQNFKYDRIPGSVFVDKSVFEKVNELANLPNANSIDHVDTIFTDYCLEKKWSKMTMITTKAIPIVELFPTVDTLLTNHNLESEDEIVKQLEESLNDLNALASNYALLAIKYLASRGGSDISIDKMKLEQYIRNDEVHFQRLFTVCLELAKNNPNDLITPHSIQLKRKRLLTQFPSLRPLFIVLSECGLRLGRILTGEEHPDELLMFDQATKEEMTAAKALQQVQSVLMSSTSKTQVIFRSLLDQIKKYAQNEEQQHLILERRLRMMFIGGGTSDVALPILRQLEDFVENENETIHVEIIYTDLAQAFLDEAKQTFEQSMLIKTNKQRFSITYHVFDVEGDNHMTTNIAIESVDIIFAANILHGTGDRVQSLSALRRLLVPGGLLILVELTRCHAYFDLFYGLLAYWWRDNDQRALLSIDQWTAHVHSAGGFDLPLTATSTKTKNAFGDSVIVVRKSRSRSILMGLPEWQQQGWLILADRNRAVARALVPYLPYSKARVIVNDNTSRVQNICHEITEMLAQYEQQLHIVFAWPLDSVIIDNNDQEAVAVKYQEVEQLCNILVQILQTILAANPSKYPFIYILTENTQEVTTNTANPLTAPLIGLARSLTIEYSGNGQGHRIKLIDLQPADERLVPALAQHLIESRWADHLDEIVLREDNNNTGNIMRLEWNYEAIRAKQRDSKAVEPQSSIKVIVPLHDADQVPFRLQVAPSRFLADLVWTYDPPLPLPLTTDQIHVRVHCVGLNFRDVLKASGLYPHIHLFGQSEKDQLPNDRDDCPGIDFSGTVIRCSPGSQLKVGDRVFGCCLRGAFHSHLCVDEQEVVRVPSDCHLAYEQLASLPTAFNTALYSLKYRVHLKPKQTVLIHAATGATGQAFIQYCQVVGAHVLATAGTDEKRRFLREQYGLEHVFNSRDLSFVTEIQKVLPNGVDVVVNSLSGPLLQASVQLLATHGQFVELGKRDIFDKNNLSLFCLRRDCTFHVIDLSLLVLGQQKNLSVEIMNDLSKYVFSGQFKPIEPITIVEPSHVIEAFTKCNLGKMMGKIVIRLASSNEKLHVDMEPQLLYKMQNEDQCMFPPVVCDQGTIVISGGFGGLGLTMSRWMVEERGIKRIVLMSRRTLSELEQPDNPQYTEWIRLKKACLSTENLASVDVVQVDVTRFDDVHDLIKQLNQTAYPVRGIIHSAVVSQDKLLNNITQDTLKLAMDAKVRGAWNLHHATQQARAPLHFFVMFSSIRNHMIDFGSAGYNAGNEFLDALAHYRSKILHQPALSISLPAVSGAGMFHRERNILTQLYSNSGVETIPTVITFELIDRLFTNQEQNPCPVIFSCNWKAMGTSTNKDYSGTYQLAQLVTQKLTEQENACSTTIDIQKGMGATQIDEIIDRTQATVARLLGTSNVERIETDRSLLAQGMDSLAGVSLYNWLGQYFGIFIPLTEILQGISIQIIAKQIFDKLEEQRRTVTSIAPTVDTSMSLDNNDNLVLTDDSSSYTGMNNVIRVIQPRINNNIGQRIVFCIDTVFPALEETLFRQQSLLSSSIYILKIPAGPSATAETIAQMRRIQPRGLYSLMTTSKQGEYLAQQIIKQLNEQHQQAGVEYFSALIDPTPVDQPKH